MTPRPLAGQYDQSALRRLTTHPNHVMSLVADLKPTYGASQTIGLALDDLFNAYVSTDAASKILRVPRGGAVQEIATDVCWAQSGGTAGTAAAIELDPVRRHMFIRAAGPARTPRTPDGRRGLRAMMNGGHTSNGLTYDRENDCMWLTFAMSATIHRIDLATGTFSAPNPACGAGVAGVSDGPCASALLYAPRSGALVRWVGGGWFFFCEYWNKVVRGVNLATNEVVTLASATTCTADSDGVGSSACIPLPLAVAWDSSRGDIYVSTESRIYKIATGKTLKPHSTMRVQAGAITVSGGGSVAVS
eukprot:tig00001095_g7049.t2